MAKTKSLSKHSRAARRATSPSINTDKSLKQVSTLARASTSAATTAPSPHPPRPSVLAAHRSAAIQKKKTSRPVRKAQMSARARRRHEKGLEMAEAVCERTANKVRRSAGRQRVVNARRKAWDDINRLAAADAANPFDALAGHDDDALDGEDGGEGVDTGDEDMDVVEDAVEGASRDVAANYTTIDPPQLLLPDDDQDVIL